MRHALLGTLLLLSAIAGFGQNRPSLTWEGDVEGTALLLIQGDRVTVDSRSTGTVARTSYRFTEPLDARDRVDVENRLGGARVRVLEQPRRNNNFTAIVEIDSRGRGLQRVSLDFYWEARNGAISRDRNDRSPDARYPDDRYPDERYGTDRGRAVGSRARTNDRNGAAGSGMAHWSGQVDNEVFVLLRGRQFFSTAVRGRAVYNQQTDITNPMPRRPVNVVLQDTQGRGQVEIAEHPNQANNFTAKIHIIDPENGAGAYSFTLAWDESGYNNGGYQQQTYPSQSGGGILSPGGGGYSDNNAGYGTAPTGGVRWAGQVDGRIRVSFRDNQAQTQRISGQATYGEQVSFGSPVPRRNVDVAVNKVRGRGDVDVVQRPAANNNYTLVVEIDDKDGGSDVYDLEILWR